MIKIAPLKMFAALYILTLCVGDLQASSGSDFQRGLLASRQGQYETAIRYFLKSEENGRRSAALYHNLGVAYFKSGLYDEAVAAFQKASRSGKLATLSYYNLGLVEEKRNNGRAAKTWFGKARRQARTEKLRRLAEVKLGMRDTARVPYIAYLEISAGRDSNPQLADETNTQVEEESDSFFGALAYGRYHFSGSAKQGFYLTGSAYQRRYNSVDDEDFRSLVAGGGFLQTLGHWSFDYQLSHDRLSLGGDEVQQSNLARIFARRGLTASAFVDARLRAEDVAGDEDNGYDYLSGGRYQFRMRYGDKLGRANWSMGYELSISDQGELITRSSTGAVLERYAASPVRHDVGFDLTFPVGSGLEAELELGFRTSDFGDEEVRGSVEQGVRRDHRRYASLALNYPFARAWMVNATAAYWDNSSNFEGYDYQRTEVVFSLSRSIF